MQQMFIPNFMKFNKIHLNTDVNFRLCYFSPGLSVINFLNFHQQDSDMSKLRQFSLFQFPTFHQLLLATF